MAKSYDEMVIDEINQIKKKIKEGKELIASKVSSDEGTIVLKWLKCGKTDCHCTPIIRSWTLYLPSYI